MELLEFEHKTAFDHSLWDRFQWLEFLEWSRLLRLAHAHQIAEHDYSAIQDSFYVVEEDLPNSSPAGQAWSKVMQSEVYPKLLGMITDKTSRVNVMLFLAKKYYEMLNQKEEEKKEEEKQQGGGEEEQNEPPNYQFHPDRSNQPDNQKESGEITPEDIEQVRQILGKSEEGEVEADPQAGPADMDFTPEEIESMQFSVSDKELEDLKEQIEGEQDMLGLLAGTGQSPIEQRAFVEHAFNQYALRRMSKLIGWGENIVGGAVRTNKGAVGEFAEITPKSWNANVTAMDMHLVSSGHTLGAVKMAEGKLNTKINKDEAPLGKGGVVFLHDESSSMKGDSYIKSIQRKHTEYRTPEEQEFLEQHPPKDLQAINLQLAMAHLFRKEGRAFTAIAWNDGGTRLYKYGTEGLENHLNSFLSGGTSVTHALLKAFNVIQKDPQHRNNADIILATDGETMDYPEHDPDFIRESKKYRERGGRIWGIYIGQHDLHAIQNMEKYCDAVIAIEELYTNNQIGEILRNAASNTTKHKKTLI